MTRQRAKNRATIDGVAGKRRSRHTITETTVADPRQQGLSRRQLLLVLVPSVFAVGLWMLMPSIFFSKQEYSKDHHITLSDENAAQIAQLVDVDLLMNRDVKPIMRPRVVDTPEHAQVRQHIVSTLESAGWTIELDSFEDNTPLGKKRFTNISKSAHHHHVVLTTSRSSIVKSLAFQICQFHLTTIVLPITPFCPTSPFIKFQVATWDAKATRRFVLAAHYDSKFYEDHEFVGATDSAVPCGMLLYFAQVLPSLLETRRHGLGSTLQFVFLDGEEAFVRWNEKDSIYGARHLAEKWQSQPSLSIPSTKKSPTSALDDIELFMLLDLLGAPGARFLSFFPRTEHYFMRLTDIETKLRQQQVLPASDSAIFSKILPRRAPMIEDDHIPFLQRGVPILHIIPVPFPKVWHQPTDNASAIDPREVEALTKIMLVFVCEYLGLPPNQH